MGICYIYKFKSHYWNFFSTTVHIKILFYELWAFQNIYDSYHCPLPQISISPKSAFARSAQCYFSAWSIEQEEHQNRCSVPAEIPQGGVVSKKDVRLITSTSSLILVRILNHTISESFTSNLTVLLFNNGENGN